jgi:hypothetical protein
MDTAMRRCFLLVAMLVGMLFSLAAQAAYQFTTVDYPGAVSTSFWGINDLGQVVGQAQFVVDGPTVNFIYDVKKGTFTPVSAPVDTGLLGINASPVLVGGITDASGVETGIIRRTNGSYQSFSVPGWDNSEARGVNNQGMVSGFAYHVDKSDPDPNNWFIDHSTGFIYDTAHALFVDFLQSASPNPTIAQGINGLGDVVGSVVLAANAPGTGCVDPTRYGFVRSASAAFKYFRVNGGNTAARGINDAGLIAGFAGGEGFVVSLPAGPTCQSLTVSAGNLLSSNDPNDVGTFAQGINNAAIVSGAWQEYLGGDPDLSSSFTMHGFIAVPIASTKDQCKSGWQWLVRADGTFFKNQGDCIQYVNTGK